MKANYVLSRFQELCLAGRRLLFVGEKMIFACHSTSFWSKNIVAEDLNFVRWEATMNKKPEDGSDIRYYEGPVEGFSPHTLSFQSDIYAAFRRVSRDIMRQLETDLCHGVPPRYFDWLSSGSLRVPQSADLGYLVGPGQAEKVARLW